MPRPTFSSNSPLLSSQSSSTGKLISLMEDSEALGVLQESARALGGLLESARANSNLNLENGDGEGGATINLDGGLLALGTVATVFMGRQLQLAGWWGKQN